MKLMIQESKELSGRIKDKDIKKVVGARLGYNIDNPKAKANCNYSA